MENSIVMVVHITLQNICVTDVFGGELTVNGITRGQGKPMLSLFVKEHFCNTKKIWDQLSPVTPRIHCQ